METQNKQNNFITVKTYSKAWMANLDKSFLENHDIEANLKDENVNEMFQHVQIAMGGIKLQVREADKVIAEQLLEEKYKPEFIAEVYEDEYYEKHCPFCNSDNISFTKYSASTMLWSLFLFGIPIFLAEKKGYCYDCEERWSFPSGRMLKVVFLILLIVSIFIVIN